MAVTSNRGPLAAFFANLVDTTNRPTLCRRGSRDSGEHSLLSDQLWGLWRYSILYMDLDT